MSFSLEDLLADFDPAKLAELKDKLQTVLTSVQSVLKDAAPVLDLLPVPELKTYVAEAESVIAVLLSILEKL
jgi:hypothetical protein